MCLYVCLLQPTDYTRPHLDKDFLLLVVVVFFIVVLVFICLFEAEFWASQADLKLSVYLELSLMS